MQLCERLRFGLLLGLRLGLSISIGMRRCEARSLGGLCVREGDVFAERSFER